MVRELNSTQYKYAHDTGKTRKYYEALHKAVSAQRKAAGLPVFPVVPASPDAVNIKRSK